MRLFWRDNAFTDEEYAEIASNAERVLRDEKQTRTNMLALLVLGKNLEFVLTHYGLMQKGDSIDLSIIVDAIEEYAQKRSIEQ